MEKFKYHRIHDLIPGGCHTYSRGDDQFPVNAPPLLARGSGCYVWDEKGNKYLDYGMGLRSVTVGYANQRINQAAIDQINNGNNLTRASTVEFQAAEKFLSIMDNSDMVKFAKNGSNVTTAAVKLARSYTGRKYILRCTDQPFFSFDDWFIGDTVIKKGIPSEVSSLTLGFNYNDIDSVEKILTDERYKNDIAAVILEPVNVVEPKVFGQENFLEYLRRRTDEMCIVLIFDEIVTGFRLHEKGVQAKYNVKPDLSTFGKAMANGFSLAALCGRKPIMELGGIRKEQDERTFLLSSTYGSEMSSYGAFLETCKVYDEYNVVQHLNNYGKKLKSEMNKISKSLGIQEYFYVDGFDASPYYVTKGLDGQNSYALRTVFNEKMIENSVMMPWMAFSLSHGEDEIEKTLIAVEDSLKEYQRCLEGVDLKSGHIIKPVFRKFN